MLGFTRPPKPAGFDASTRAPREEIDAIIARGEDPSSKQFKGRWQNYRVTFANAQHRKCGYCEERPKTEYGAVEHYAPKSRIQRFVREVGGLDEEGLTRTHEVRVHRTRGYYWRAYDWDNYLFACTFCNTRHKRELFPVVDDADDDPDFPARDIHVEPLLLHPYEPGFEPHEHFEYRFSGAIIGKRPRGSETVRTCRLDRHGLTLARRKQAKPVRRLMNELAERFEDEDASRAVAAELLALGAEDKPFAGMVRVLVWQELGLSWPELEALAEA